MAVSALKITSLDDYETFTVLDLINEFKELSQRVDAEKVTIEQQKLKIIQAFETIIKTSLPATSPLAIPRIKEPPFALDQLYRDAWYYLIFTFGLFQSAAESYLFGLALFSLIPAIPCAVLITATLVFTVLNSVLFYAFDVAFLKKTLGITDSSAEFQLYSSQLKSAIVIHQLLTNIHMLNIDKELYEQFRQLASVINQDIKRKVDAIGPYPDSILKTILEAGVLAFGALASIAGSYFFANSLMTMLAVSLIGTPVEWAIVGLTILSGLWFYYAMEASSMINLVNPRMDKEDLELFEAVYKDDLKHVSDTKRRYIERTSSSNLAGLSIFVPASANDLNVRTTPPISIDSPDSAMSPSNLAPLSLHV